MGRPSPPFRMPRLASHFANLESQYDAVVVGSGYGGGIAAARLARADLSVCVLERGLELHPGEYPSSLGDARRSFQVHARNRRLGPETGLFDFRVGKDINVLVGCGLGGTSLINANVCLEARDWVFREACWPEELRGDLDELRNGIARAHAMLGTSTEQPWELHKLVQLQRQAGAFASEGADFVKAPLAVSFKTGPNRVGIEQVECKHCGDCVSGCNHGAKNTVLMNYLPYARAHGAQIFTEVRVDWLERADDCWLVRFQRVGSGEDQFPGPHRFVRAKLVVLAAGTLGSTQILLRSRKEGLALSDRLGHSFSGNGDTWSFAYNSPHPVNGVGLGEERLDDHEPVGPCIAGLIDLRGEDDPNGIVIEDGSPPGAIGKLLPSFLAFMSPWAGGHSRLLDPMRARWRKLRSLPAKPYRGAMRNTQTHLVMAHDSASGRLELSRKNRLRIRFCGVGNQPIFQRIDELLERASEAVGARHIQNPIWDKLWVRPLRRIWYLLIGAYRRKKKGNRDLVTVHPLGGCPMGADAEAGVVNARHQVFRGNAGSEVYDSLYVMDGAVVPRSLGVNPLLTISGLAERACHHLLRDHEHGELEYDFPLKPLPPEERRPGTLGLRFSERLAGHVTRLRASDEPDLDYAEAERRGKQEGSTCAVVLDMEIPDLDAFLESPDHEFAVSGVATAPKIFEGPAMVVAGSHARILSWSKQKVNTREMIYELNLVTEKGEKFRLVGEKYVTDHYWPWPAIRETLVERTRIYRGEPRASAEGPQDPDLPAVEAGSESDSGPPEELARGVIYVGFRDFVKQRLTERPVNPRGFWDGLGARWRFNSWFLRTLSGHMHPLLAAPNAVDREVKRKARKLETPEGEVHSVKTEDEVEIRLTRYQAGEKGPVLLSHGLGVSSRIFSIDTIETNLLEHLCEKGYDVWLLDYRASTELPHACFEQFSGDEVARYDYPAAVDFVRANTRAKDVQMVVHCFGSTTFFMSMLGKYLAPEKVRSVVVSQIATHMITSLDTRLKAGLYAGNWINWLGWRYLNAYTDDAAARLERGWNRLLRFLPVAREERCRSDVCHRISYLYSLLYEHDQLDPDTHACLHEMFGVANVRALRHLAEMSRQGHLADARGNDAYIKQMGECLHFPIRFIHGAENYCFKPVSTQITLELLQELQRDLEASERVAYDRFEIEGYGHIDCIFGRNAVRDVYPLISEHLDRHQ